MECRYPLSFLEAFSYGLHRWVEPVDAAWRQNRLHPCEGIEPEALLSESPRNVGNRRRRLLGKAACLWAWCGDVEQRLQRLRLLE